MKEHQLTRSFGETSFGQTDLPVKIGHHTLAGARGPQGDERPGRSARRSWKSRRKTKWRTNAGN